MLTAPGSLRQACQPATCNFPLAGAVPGGSCSPSPLPTHRHCQPPLAPPRQDLLSLPGRPRQAAASRQGGLEMLLCLLLVPWAAVMPRRGAWCR